MQRYFLKQYPMENKFIIDNDDVNHIVKVMRMKISDQVIICNEENTYLCEIINLNNKEVILEIKEEIIENKKMPIQVTIAHGIVSKEKMETVIDNITELGAYEYMMVKMERCNFLINEDKIDKKMIRLKKIAKEAAEQSHRDSILKVHEPISFKDLLKRSKNYDLCLYAYEKSTKDDSFKELIKKFTGNKILVVIGPEGGISEYEVEKMKENNFFPMTLGPRILRTEVAPTYVLSAISYEKEL